MTQQTQTVTHSRYRAVCVGGEVEVKREIFLFRFGMSFEIEKWQISII